MARLYADENFPLPVVEELRQLGHDVLTIQESGRETASAGFHHRGASGCGKDREPLIAGQHHSGSSSPRRRQSPFAGLLP